MRQRAILMRAGIVGLVCVSVVGGGCGQPDVPPFQGRPPASGPGAPKNVRMTRLGDGRQEIFVYEPVQAGRTTAPVVAFIHGYTRVNPVVYGAWIRHLVLRGNIVLYPVYQDSLEGAEHYTADALTALQSAYAALQTEDHIRPEAGRFALVGHSLGGVMAMNLAALLEENNLPPAVALFVANPGDATAARIPLPSIQADNYEQIPGGVLFLAVVGDEDTVVGEDRALLLYDRLPQVPAANREVIRLRSDKHGIPPLLANHGAALAIDREFDSGATVQLLPNGRTLGLDTLGANFALPDLFDYYGYWKWCDGLLDAAFYGENREYALGDTVEQTYMGQWGDGEPVMTAVRIRP